VGAAVKGSPVPIRDRWHRLRDRLLTSPAFEHWASRSPLTRFVARRRARALFDLCSGFVYSQILHACVRLGLFPVLGEGPKTLDELATRLSLSRDAVLRLLSAAASLKLVERRGGGRFGLGPLGASVLGNPGIAAMVEHHSLLYRDLADPVALLRGERGELAGFWPYAAGDAPDSLGDNEVAEYSALMAVSQRFVADQVLDACDLRDRTCLMDVGGGEGAFISAVAARWPHLRFVLFDLPAVAERARTHLASEGLQDRVELVGGDFFSDSLPAGADTVSLVRVLHDHDDESVLTILRAARRALPDDGMLLVAEPMSGTTGAEPAGDAYFGMYLLAMGKGRPRSPAENKALLERAGFHRVRLKSTSLPIQTRVLVARPAPA